jgi:hypothetical protein
MPDRESQKQHRQEDKTFCEALHWGSFRDAGIVHYSVSFEKGS